MALCGDAALACKPRAGAGRPRRIRREPSYEGGRNMSEKADEIEAVIDVIEDTLTRTFLKIAMVGFVAGAVLGLGAAVVIGVCWGRL